MTDHQNADTKNDGFNQLRLMGASGVHLIHFLDSAYEGFGPGVWEEACGVVLDALDGMGLQRRKYPEGPFPSQAVTGSA